MLAALEILKRQIAQRERLTTMILYQRWLLMGLILGAAEAARMSSILALVCSKAAVSLGVSWSEYRLSVAPETACAHQVKNIGVMGPLSSNDGSMH